MRTPKPLTEGFLNFIYAEDVQILIPINDSLPNALKLWDAALTEIKNLLTENFLAVNTTKTELLIITPQNNASINSFHTLQTSPAMVQQHMMEHKQWETGNHSRVTEFLLLGFSEFPELQLPLFTIFSLLYLMAIMGNLLVICIHTMEHKQWEPRNLSAVTEFLLLGFSEFPELQLPLFTLFSLLYLMGVLGNLLVICIVCAYPHLHTPMYFFLVNLSALDISSLTVTVPKFVLLSESNIISFTACIIQLYCFIACVGTEITLLAAMAYDRYVAICNPLRYTTIMNKRVCALLAAVSWLAGLIDSLPQAIFTSQFSFCDSNVINHFFCELTALQEISCTDTSVILTMSYIESVFAGLTPFLLTLTSYTFIISTILRIRSREGKSKAFSTCSSHLTVLILLYGTMLGIYMQPRSASSLKSNKLVTAAYILTLPLLNPLIYSLRSKELNVALKKALNRKSTLSVTKHF
ncbi:olfactory receptor 5V1-like [Rhinatrema bivittatum]|uniref:olfactory receptor 5V1-like n=1 Tax=Rhinatrema bivittatum TaxID=194408 RepID=UPI00112A0501|nr:olfactory receptor 5V1-like [Rhinatrema bivittatum]